MDEEVKEIQTQLKKDLNAKVEDKEIRRGKMGSAKKKNKKCKISDALLIENDALVKFSKLLISTKRLSVIDKFGESLKK